VAVALQAPQLYTADIRSGHLEVRSPVLEFGDCGIPAAAVANALFKQNFETVQSLQVQLWLDHGERERAIGCCHFRAHQLDC
jgi:hypothetical protein